MVKPRNLLVHSFFPGIENINTREIQFARKSVRRSYYMTSSASGQDESNPAL